MQRRPGFDPLNPPPSIASESQRDPRLVQSVLRRIEVMLLSVLVTGAPWVSFDALARAQISLDFFLSSKNFSSISLM